MNPPSRDDIIERAIGAYGENNYVDVIKLARELDIEVYSKQGEDFSARICYDRSLDKFYIQVNPDHPITRQRFSIAHELAHYILHNEEIKQHGAVDRENEESLGTDKERAADALAADILMPDSVVKKYIEDNNMNSDHPIKKSSVKKIADYFKVSIMVAILKLKSLNYYVQYIQFA